MRHVSKTRAFVAGVVILTMLLSITVLFGAQKSAVKITSPAAKATVHGVITIKANITLDQSVSYAILVVDEDRPGASNTQPYSFSLDTRELADGAHKISVEAYDDFGLLAASKPITIYIKNNAKAPVQAKQSPKTQVASKPVAPATSVTGQTANPNARLATEPAGTTTAHTADPASSAPRAPAKSVEGDTRSIFPLTVVAMEKMTASGTTAPIAIGQGPKPEPTRTTSVPTIAPKRVTGAAATTNTGVASGTKTTSPKLTQARVGGNRGHTVFLNGRAIEFDVVPVIEKGRMQGGFRALFATTGARVSWQEQTRTARSVSDTLTVEVPTGSRIARVNGKGVDMGVPSQVRSGRTFIPVRFFADVTGAVLVWDNQTGVAQLRLAPKTEVARAQ